MSQLTGIAQLDLLTMLPWRNVIAGIGLLSPHCRWCPLCFAQDLSEGREPYFRLAWDIGTVDACPKHAAKLVGFCPNCG
ncbi:TniQ family protein, partial [Chryseobacterium sp. SIMBA_028]|uniref:TniQ family protein n=1 Tax=Chryseobacterium sp. SIMBA_028 TaxID=3085771 RepID=UPI00397B8339